MITHSSHAHIMHKQSHAAHSAYSACRQPSSDFWASSTKRVIKTSKQGWNASFPPHSFSFGGDFYGNLQVAFLCNLYSSVIFRNPGESFSVGAGDEMKARVEMKQLELGSCCKPRPLHGSRPSTPTCCHYTASHRCH